jgi:type I restriction enzyme R subunit
MIDDYNEGRMNVDEFFAALVQMAQELREEEQRHVAEKLSEEELTLFDILTRPPLGLTKKEKELVKKVARDLLKVLKEERLVLDWRKTQQTRAGVRVAIEEELDKLPEAYTRELYTEKCNLVYEHVYESYWGEGQSIYVSA